VKDGDISRRGDKVSPGKTNTFYHACVLRRRNGGMKNLFVGRKSLLICFTQYTIHSMDGEAAFQTHIVVKYYKGKYNVKE